MVDQEQADTALPADLRQRLKYLGLQFDHLLAQHLEDQDFPTEVSALLDALCAVVVSLLPDQIVAVHVIWPGDQSESNESDPGDSNGHHELERFSLSFRPGYQLDLQFFPEVSETNRYLLVQAIARLFDSLHVRELEYALYADQPDLLQALNDIRVQQAAQEEQVVTLESRLLQSEKMAAIGQLAAGVAHEINNPVGYVGSNLNALHDYMSSLLSLVDDLNEQLVQADLNVDHRQQVDTLLLASDLDYIRSDLPVLMQESQEGIERVRRTVQDLKDFSRTDSLDFDWSDINEGLRKTLNIVHFELKHRANVLLELGELPRVYCAANQLNQVFLNVLLNAGQALETRGEIQVRTRHEQDWVSIEITDNGVGMTDETQRRLFEPFYTTKLPGSGTGLGLSISLRIIEQHSGRIDVQSTRGVGTTFIIRLPVNPSHVQEASDE